MKPRLKPIHCSKVGTHVASSGVEVTFTEADFRASCEAYDPQLHRASICVGHPKTDGPAYGIVSALRLVGGKDLYAEASDVDPAFAELVDKKRFHTVSMAFYHPNSRLNPKPGVYYPRHLGCLGAEPPAIKGLKPPEVEFDEASDDDLVFAEVAFSEHGIGLVADSFRRLREFLIEQFGLVKADVALPSWQVDALQQVAREPDDQTSFNPAFSEGNPTTEDDVSADQLAKLQADLAAANKRADDAAAALQASNAAAAAAERTARHEDNLAFAEGLVKGDQLLPADRDLVVAALDAANGDQAEKAIEFGEGDNKKSLGEALRGLLAKLPKHGLTGEHVAKKGERTAGGVDDPLEFGEHTQVDAASLERHHRALALVKDKGIGYAEAARQVARS